MIDSTETLEAPIYTIAKCLNEIIVNTDLDDALQNIVDWLAESLAIDICYISEFGNSTSNRVYAAQKSLDSGCFKSGNNELVMKIEEFPEIYNVLTENFCFKVSINNKASDELREWLQKSDLKSLLLIPVFRGNKFWGSIGLCDTKNTRTWRNSEVQLQSLASAIGAAIEAGSIKKDIEKKNEAFNTTLSKLNEIIWDVDLVTKVSKVAGSASFIRNLKRSASSDNILDWIKDGVHEDDKERVFSKFQRVLQNPKCTVDEDVCRIYNQRTGKYFWMHSRYVIRRDSVGEALSLTGTSVDISETKEVGYELTRQRDQYQFLVQSFGQVVFTLDKTARFSSISSAWEDLIGVDANQCIGDNFIQYICDSHVHLFWQDLSNMLEGGKMSFDRQMQLVKSCGEKIWVRVMAKVSFDYQNEIDGFFGTIENINDKYNAELVLQESNEQIKTILNNSKEILLTIDLEKNTIANVNDAIAILGYKPEEWIGKSYKLWENDQRQKFHELMKLAVQSELKVQNQQIYFPNKSNTESIPFEFSTSIFYFKNRKFLLCVLRDIRERLKYQENISRISTQLTHLLNNIDDVYAIFDLKTQKYDFVSDNVEGLYGCDKQSYFNNPALWKNCIHREDVPGVEKEIEQIIQNKSRGEVFYRITTCTGEKKMLLEKLVVGKDEKGNAEKLYIVKTDYTNIENAEQSLMETERKFKFISENLSDFISIHDTDWNFTYASPSIKNILGFLPDEVLGIGGFDLVHPDDLLTVLNNSLQPLVIEKKETQFRCRMLSKSGVYKWVETYSKPVIDSKGEISSIISSTRDVTEQVNAVTRLRDSEEQYRLLSENSNDVIGIHTLSREFTYVSPSCRQVLGYEPEELLGKRPREVFAKDEERNAFLNERIDESLQLKQDFKFVTKVVTKSGDEKWLEIWLKPLFKGDQLIGMQSASRDVTEREKLLVELEQSLAKERELNELRAKFVSTASHQFRTPLTVIQSGVEIMDLYLDDLPAEKQAKFQKQFNKIQEEVDRLESLMNDVLLLGRANAARTPFNPIKDSVVDFCKNIIDNKYNNRYPADRQIILSVKGEEQQVSFDPKLLGHSIENIISNAYKYSDKGNLALDIRYHGRQVDIEITDQGIGIPPEDIRNLFQPFSRATNTSDIAGTGLGLSIVKEFVEKHDGKIFLTSQLNKGTTVSVILPID